MAEEVNEKCNVKNILFSENATSLELPDLAKHDKIKLDEMTDILDNMKAKVSIPKVQCNMINDNVKIENDFSPDDIKVEDYGLQYCEHCATYYEGYCVECGMLVHILNRIVLNNADNGGQKDLPNDSLEIRHSLGDIGIFTLKVIPEGVKFGPFTGAERPWKIKGGKFIVHVDKSIYLNWMQYVNHARNISEQNLFVFQTGDNLYYQSTRQIQAGEELLVYFGVEYDDSLNENVEVDFSPIIEHNVKNVFACTFCCLGFNSKFHLAKHKTKCLEDAVTGRCSIEELTQCSFCNIQLDPKEYLEHHMVYCRARNVRECALPIQRNPLVEVMERKTRGPYQIYKCEQCKYRTKYKAELTAHTLQHYGRFKAKESVGLHLENTPVFVDVKEDPDDYRECVPPIPINPLAEVKRRKKRYPPQIYKCEQCRYSTKYKAELRLHTNQHYGRFKAKESVGLHLENTPVFVDVKEEPEDSTCDHIEVEQSNAQGQTETFKCLKVHTSGKHFKEFHYKCDRCEYRTKRKLNLVGHVKTKHLKQFDFKCDKCEYRTNRKDSLNRHKIVKHFEKFDYKCDKCEYRTNNKTDLKQHLRIKHLDDFDYKCDKCEYITNRKDSLNIHKTVKHLEKFDYKCDKCEFITNNKTDFRQHIKTNHLNELNYKCDRCEYKTKHRSSLKCHIKTRHLKQFDFKCDECEFQSNYRADLEKHRKAKHLNEFNYKCDSCEYRTNQKNHLDRHMTTRHFKEFNFNCDWCEFKTKHKTCLNGHVKTRHLKEFTFKCDECEFGTNRKYELKKHIKTKHLNEFDYKCDECDFKTNLKNNFNKHIKTKHLKEFDHKCDFCEYNTNSKSNLEKHVKTIHLKEFNYKCDLCEFRTNNKYHFEAHRKSKHLKEFDHKCDSCEFRTYTRYHLQRHIKTKHLKEFDHICELCEFRTNIKQKLQVHINAKHSK